MVEVKERPILFSAPMVNAILRDQKTQTRRNVKSSKWQDIGSLPIVEYARDGGPIWWSSEPSDGIRQSDYYDLGTPCPYGKPGERLWVREAFSAWFHFAHWYGSEREFRRQDICTNLFYRATHHFPDDDQKWVPGIFMPRWASRIALEITEVRVERLQDISEGDAQAEGVQRPILSATEINGMRVHPLTGYYRDGFRELWDRINGKGSWDKNPWVWALSFKRIS